MSPSFKIQTHSCSSLVKLVVLRWLLNISCSGRDIIVEYIVFRFFPSRSTKILYRTFPYKNIILFAVKDRLK